MRVSVKEFRVGLRNSTVRIPFRYANTCLTRCPQAVMGVVAEVDGSLQEGYSGDCLPPGWFDKDPGKDFEQQIADMLNAMQLAAELFRGATRSSITLFEAWHGVYQEVHQWAADHGLPPLVAAFGVSFMERALMDAIARHANCSFDAALRQDLFGVRPGAIHPVLADRSVRDWLPAAPRETIYARHTIGLSDPLTAGDIPADERLDDGWPQALEEYVQRNGICYYKVKVANQLSSDLARVRAIAAIVERHRGGDYRVTLDGNEQYKEPSDFDNLVDAIRSEPELETFWDNVLLVEQPLDRRIALDPTYTDGIRELSRSKPVVIDESDGRLEDGLRAFECGYRGVSSKNCKGPTKSILNAGLVWSKNQEAGDGAYMMTGEDLCAVGVIPVQSDLCLVASLGLEHVERNGHHFHPGLNYLEPSQQQEALAAHPDLYETRQGRVAPVVRNGQLQIGSLQCPGFGFSVVPRWEDYQDPADWKFTSLGLT